MLLTYAGTLSGAGLTVGASVPAGFNYRLGTGEGQVNLLADAWALGDVNHDGPINSLDLDALYANFGNVTANLALARYDVSGDNVVSRADVTYELNNIMHRTYADANLDGVVDALDFQILLNNWQSSGATWATADFNGDGLTEALDFQIMLDYWNPTGIGASNSATSATDMSTSSANATTTTVQTTVTESTTDASTNEEGQAISSTVTTTDTSAATTTDDATTTSADATVPAKTVLLPSSLATADVLALPPTIRESSAPTKAVEADSGTVARYAAIRRSFESQPVWREVSTEHNPAPRLIQAGSPTANSWDDSDADLLADLNRPIFVWPRHGITSCRTQPFPCR
jgi:hypothetical protein